MTGGPPAGCPRRRHPRRSLTRARRSRRRGAAASARHRAMKLGVWSRRRAGDYSARLVSAAAARLPVVGMRRARASAVPYGPTPLTAIRKEGETLSGEGLAALRSVGQRHEQARRSPSGGSGRVLGRLHVEPAICVARDKRKDRLLLIVSRIRHGLHSRLEGYRAFARCLQPDRKAKHSVASTATEVQRAQRRPGVGPTISTPQRGSQKGQRPSPQCAAESGSCSQLVLARPDQVDRKQAWKDDQKPTHGLDIVCYLPQHNPTCPQRDSD